jgi:hypothetical protein
MVSIASALAARSVRTGTIRDDATAVPNTATETVIATHTVAANILNAGTLIEARFGLTAITAVSAATHQFQLRLSTVAAPTAGDILWTMTAADLTNSLTLSLDLNIYSVVRSVAGALPTFQTTGTLLLTTAAGASLQSFVNVVNKVATLSQNQNRVLVLTGNLSAGADSVVLSNGFIRISRPTPGMQVTTP